VFSDEGKFVRITWFLTISFVFFMSEFLDIFKDGKYKKHGFIVQIRLQSPRLLVVGSSVPLLGELA